MIISYSRNFIFVHANKCGGTSVNKSLKKELSGEDIIIGGTRESPQLNKFYEAEYGIWKHAQARKIKEFVGEKFWEAAFKFSFVRNPYDRVVSNYFYLIKSRKSNPDHFIHKYPSFDDYVLSDDFKLVSQTDMMLDENHKKMLDYVGRLESFNEDFSYVCGRIGIQQVKLGKHNTTKKKDSIDFYSNQEVKDRVIERFIKDFEKFGYEV